MPRIPRIESPFDKTDLIWIEISISPSNDQDQDSGTSLRCVAALAAVQASLAVVIIQSVRVNLHCPDDRRARLGSN